MRQLLMRRSLVSERDGDSPSRSNRSPSSNRFDVNDRTSLCDRHLAQIETLFATMRDLNGRNGLNCFAIESRIGRNYLSEAASCGRSLPSSRREEPSSLESRIAFATPSHIRVPTMMISRLTRTLIASICLTVFLSGCCVTSMKLRKHSSCPCESQSGSGLAPIQQGIPAEYEPLPSPAPLPPSPSPSSASKTRDFGTKTVAMFRSAGCKVVSSFDQLN